MYSEKLHVLLLAVGLTEGRKTGECCLAREHRVAENHEETTNNGEVAEEEIKVENETVTDGLHDDHCEETADGVFCISLCNNRS